MFIMRIMSQKTYGKEISIILNVKVQSLNTGFQLISNQNSVVFKTFLLMLKIFNLGKNKIKNIVICIVCATFTLFRNILNIHN